MGCNTYMNIHTSTKISNNKKLVSLCPMSYQRRGAYSHIPSLRRNNSDESLPK